MAISLPVEPSEVLGLPASASLSDIRGAYRDKALRYHPDTGGEGWAFRIVTQAYEWMLTQRVSQRVHEEEAREATRQRAHRPAEPERPHDPAGHKPTVHASDDDDTHARRAVRDQVADESHLVDVEFFTIRFELSDPSQLLYTRAEDRTLTCSLNVTWPSRDSNVPRGNDNESRAIVAGAFRSLVKKTRAKISHIQDDPTTFSAWVSYPTQTKASEAFELFREMLREHNFGAAQWMRDVIIPKTSH